MTQPVYAPVYYQGDGNQQTFPFPFYISSASNLKVVHTDVDGVDTIFALGIDFTAEFVAGTQGPGSVVTTVALAVDERLAIFNVEVLIQDTDIKNQGKYLAIWVEQALDKVTRITQQQYIDILKSMRLPDGVSESDFDTSLPSNLLQSAGAALIVNQTGNGFVTGIPSGSSLEGVDDSDTIDLSLAANILTAEVKSGSLLDTHIASGAGIVRTKFATGTANRLVQNADSTGIMSDAAAITAARVLISDANGIPTHSSVTSTILAFLDATSSIQTQLDLMVEKSGDTMSGDLNLAGDPTNPNHATTKLYVDTAVQGLTNKKIAVRAASVVNGTLATAFDNGSVIDGVTLATGDRILLPAQTAQEENGLYDVQASGAPVRVTDADDWDELVAASVLVLEGTINQGTRWFCTIETGGTLETDPITWVQDSLEAGLSAGDGLQTTGSIISVKLDGATLSSSASGLKIATGGVLNAQIGASAGIEYSKMEALTPNFALKSSSTGEPEPSAVTDVELAYLDGVTSAIQTQLDARIAAALMTTNGDMIYRAAGVPAKLAVSANGKVLTVTAGMPAWADSQAAGQNISESFFEGNASAGSENLTLSAWTPFALSDVAESSGSPFVRSGNDLTPAFTGKYTCEVNIPKAESNISSGVFGARVRNMTTGATVSNLTPNWDHDPDGASIRCYGDFPVTSILHVFQVQYYATGGGGSASFSISNVSVGGEVPPRWSIHLKRLGA